MNAPVNRDLLSYNAQQPPKLKKDWEGKLLRVHTFPQHSYWEPGTTNRKECLEPLVPAGAVLDLRKRYTDGGAPRLVCDWPCPCCGHKHERIIPEEYVTKGKAEFVEPAECNPFAKPTIYLASPYSHPDATVREQNWLAAAAAAAWLMQRGNTDFGEGYTVFSPISMGHPISVMGASTGLGFNFTTWQRTSITLMQSCTHLVLLFLDDWHLSTGCKAEVDYARQCGLPVWGLLPSTKGEAYTLKQDAEHYFQSFGVWA